MSVIIEAPLRCDECGHSFELSGGGVCRVCGRVLCMQHFSASEQRPWRLRKGDLMGPKGPICRTCASRASKVPDAG